MTPTPTPTQDRRGVASRTRQIETTTSRPHQRRQTGIANAASPQRWLRTAGWLAALAGFLLALWSLARVAGGLDSAASGHRQIALLGLGVLLLGLDRMTGQLAPPATHRRIGCYTILCGATLQAIGTLGSLAIPALGWLPPIGAGVMLVGLLRLLSSPAWSPRAGEMKFLLGIISLGVALDALLAVASLNPEWLGIEWAAMPDALQTRLLRLARSAAMILPVVAALGHERAAGGLAAGAVFSRNPVAHYVWALYAGAAAMPLVLMAAALWNPLWKFALPVPAITVFAGVYFTVRRSRLTASTLELGGWLLIAASMAAGLVMGFYAFDGPLTPPAPIGAYGTAARTLLRLSHAWIIFAGILAIFLARQRQPARQHQSGGQQRRPIGGTS